MDLVGGSKMVGCDWMWVSKDLKLVAHVSQQLQFATLRIKSKKKMRIDTHETIKS